MDDPACVELVERGICRTWTSKVATEAQAAAAQLPITEVLVSPYIRTLQTAQLLFANMSLPMRVCPLVSEVVVFGCDVSSYIGEPIAGFESFDWSEMSGGNGQDYWLYPRMDPTIRNTLDMTDIRTSLSTNIEANGFQKVETDESVAKRIAEFKQKVAGRNDVAVVTHYAFINRYFNDYKAQNCEFVEVPN